MQRSIQRNRSKLSEPIRRSRRAAARHRWGTSCTAPACMAWRAAVSGSGSCPNRSPPISSSAHSPGITPTAASSSGPGPSPGARRTPAVAIDGIGRGLLRQLDDRGVLVADAGRTAGHPDLEHPPRAGERDVGVPRNLAQPTAPSRPARLAHCSSVAASAGLAVPGLHVESLELRQRDAAKAGDG